MSDMNIGNTSITFSKKVKNLGVYFDSSLSMSAHVSQTAWCVYSELRKIKRIRDLISTDIAKMLVSSLVLSRLDYCNSTLADVTKENINKLQVVQNYSARIVLKKSKRESASPLLRSLHWLPVEKRIDYKIAILCYKCVCIT